MLLGQSTHASNAVACVCRPSVVQVVLPPLRAIRCRHPVRRTRRLSPCTLLTPNARRRACCAHLCEVPLQGGPVPCPREQPVQRCPCVGRRTAHQDGVHHRLQAARQRQACRASDRTERWRPRWEHQKAVQAALHRRPRCRSCARSFRHVACGWAQRGRETGRLTCQVA